VARASPPAEDLEPERDGRECADQEERPANRPALRVGKAIREQQPKSGAQSRTGSGNQAEFR
jgi:hypothetical protein